MGRRSKPSQSKVQQSSVDGGRPCSGKAWGLSLGRALPAAQAVGVSGDKGVLLPPEAGRKPFTRETQFLLSGGQGGGSVSLLYQLFLK